MSAAVLGDTPARPRVVTCNIISVDGRLTLAPGVSLMAGDERWAAIAGAADPYTWVRELHSPDLMLEGSASFVPDDAPALEYADPAAGACDDPELLSEFAPPEVLGAPGRRWFGVVDGRGRVRLQFTEWPDPAWAGWHAMVLTSRAVSQRHLAALRAQGVPYLVAGAGRVDLRVALARLRSRFGVRTVVVTGGRRLGGAFLRLGLVDEIDVEVLPAAIGGRGTPALFDAPPLEAHESPTPLSLLDVARADGRLRLRYQVVRGPQS